MAATLTLHSLEARLSGVTQALKAVPVATWRILVIAIALVWIVHNLARLVWLVIPAPELQAPSKIALQTASATQQGSSYSVDLAAMQAESIFGESSVDASVDPEPTEIKEVAEDVEETNLNLTLVGVLASNDTRRSSATIADGGRQEVYKIDDKLPVGNNVKLAKVLSNRVILDNNGNFEALWLFSDDSIKIASRSNSRPQRAAEPDSESSAGDAPAAATIKASQLPSSIGDVVRFSVHREDGKMVGLRVRPGKLREFFDKAGLQANDIVTAVNGIAIDSPQVLRDTYAQLKSSQAADLELRRGSEVLYQTISIDNEG